MNAPTPKRELKVVCLTALGFQAFPCDDPELGKLIAKAQASLKWWIVDSAGVFVSSGDDEQN